VKRTKEGADGRYAQLSNLGLQLPPDNRSSGVHWLVEIGQDILGVVLVTLLGVVYHRPALPPDNRTLRAHTLITLKISGYYPLFLVILYNVIDTST
jgi:hypothetical protein